MEVFHTGQTRRATRRPRAWTQRSSKANSAQTTTVQTCSHKFSGTFTYHQMLTKPTLDSQIQSWPLIYHSGQNNTGATPRRSMSICTKHATGVRRSMRLIDKATRNTPPAHANNMPCKRSRLRRRHVNLAIKDKWNEVYTELDNNIANIDDFDQANPSHAQHAHKNQHIAHISSRR